MVICIFEIIFSDRYHICSLNALRALASSQDLSPYCSAEPFLSDILKTVILNLTEPSFHPILETTESPNRKPIQERLSEHTHINLEESVYNISEDVLSATVFFTSPKSMQHLLAHIKK